MAVDTFLLVSAVLLATDDGDPLMHSNFLKFACVAAALAGFSAVASADTPPPPSNGQQQQSLTPDLKKNEVKREGRRGSYPLHYGWNHEYCRYSEWEDFDHKYHKLAFYNRDGSVFWAEWPYDYNDYHDIYLIYEACHRYKYGYDIWVDDPTGKLHWSKIRIRHEQ